MPHICPGNPVYGSPQFADVIERLKERANDSAGTATPLAETFVAPTLICKKKSLQDHSLVQFKFALYDMQPWSMLRVQRCRNN